MNPETFIGQFAKESGIPVKTIRYYEEIGLLPQASRSESGYRLYRPELAERLHFIKRAKGLGLQLHEIKEIIQLADGGRCPCGHVQRSLQTRLSELRRKIADLRLVEKAIKSALHSGRPKNFKPRGQAVCPMIDRGQPLRRTT